jgi:hypothetical protein
MVTYDPMSHNGVEQRSRNPARLSVEVVPGARLLFDDAPYLQRAE